MRAQGYVTVEVPISLPSAVARRKVFACLSGRLVLLLPPISCLRLARHDLTQGRERWQSVDSRCHSPRPNRIVDVLDDFHPTGVDVVWVVSHDDLAA